MEPFEIAGGLVCSWRFPMASRARAIVPPGLVGVMERLDDLVGRRLGEEHLALRKLNEEVAAGLDEPSDRAVQRLVIALEGVAEQDPGFAEALNSQVAELMGAAMLSFLSQPPGRPSAGRRRPPWWQWWSKK
ncbi:chromosome partitioning protein [Streptacidiphilus sp. 4-A2]|nr:chromosome partitioning protein [Streptacidiphilus sp. 4-A2]